MKRFSLRLLVGLSLAALLWSAALSLSGSSRAAEMTAALFEPRPIPRIAPGTRLGDEPPAGWTHLIIKFEPRLEPDQAEKISKIAADFADMFASAMVARVEPDPATQAAPFRLAAIGNGLATRIGAEDVIITRDTQRELGADLGLIARTVLSYTEDFLDRWRLVAQTPTLAVIDAPAPLLVGGAHHEYVIRFAVLLNPNDGRVFTLTWLLAADQNGRLVPASHNTRVLPANLVHRYPLHVDPKQVIAGVPTPWAFAMAEFPPGVSVPIAAELQNAGAAARLTPELTAYLERELWQIVVGSATARHRAAPESQALAR